MLDSVYYNEVMKVSKKEILVNSGTSRHIISVIWTVIIVGCWQKKNMF